MPKGTSKVMFWDPKWRHGLPGSTYPQICDVLGRCQKKMILGRLPDEPTNPTNRAVERQRVEKVPPIRRRREVSEREVSPGSIESRTL